MKENQLLITRFAPSPTGFLHIGGARTALFNYIYTKQNNGKIILRIEDTDQERNKEEYVTEIRDGLDFLGIDFAEIKKQSDNFQIHKEYLQKLIDGGFAYVSKTTEEELLEAKAKGKTLKEEVIRFKNPNKIIVFNDLIRGEIKTNTTDLGDFIIAKSLEEPIFHFSNVVDDILMGVNCIIRAEEHIANTPRQILIWEAIDEKPISRYAHIPLILNEKREKLSKRKHGELVSLKYYQNNGYLKEAIINYLAFLGWNPGGEKEIYSIEEIIELFDIHKVQKAGAIFNVVKLNWFNKEYIKLQSPSEQLKYIKEYLPNIEKFDGKLLEKLRPILIDRISYYGELKELFESGELDYYLTDPDYTNPKEIIWNKSTQEETVYNLEKVLEIIKQGIQENNNIENIWNKIFSLATEIGKGGILWPLRYSLSGKDKSPDPKTLIEILGLEVAIKRIEKAIKALKS